MEAGRTDRVAPKAAAPESPSGFAAALRDARIAARLTQAELAGLSGISLRSLSDLERGFSNRPRRDTTTMLADALGLAGARRAEFFALARGHPPAGGDPLAAPHHAAGAPHFPGAFVGRDRLLAETLAALTAGDAPILTFTGPGGVGKTRLAAEVARLLPDRGPVLAGWLALESIADDTLVIAAANEYLRAPNVHPGTPMVLVLDNFEHLMPAAARLPDLLVGAPDLRLLVTSRAPLAIRGERVVPVPPLAGPTRTTDLDAIRSGSADGPSDLTPPAMRLFTERARTVRPELDFDVATAEGRGDLAAAAAICRSLDGLPLAIELAAGQLASFSLPALRAWIERSGPGALGGAGPDRSPCQRSMRDAFTWSYDLLEEPDRALLRRLSVFGGGFTLSAAESVMADAARRLGEPPPVDLSRRLAHLAAVNLLTSAVVDAGSDEPRFRLLEVIRSFAQDRLEANPGEALALRLAHLAWVRALAGRWKPGMSRTRVNSWLDDLERERGNLRAALTWTSRSGHAADALALAADAGRFWDLRDLQREGMASLEAAVAAGEAADPAVAIPPLVWYWIGTLAVPLGDPDRCREMGAQLAALAAATGDPAVAARGAILTSLWQSERGDHAAATETALAGLASTEDADDTLPSDLLVVRARMFNRLAVAAHTYANSGEAPGLEPLSIAEAAYRQALHLSEIVGDESGMLNALAGLGVIAAERGDAEAAARCFLQGFPLAAPHRHWWYLWLLMLGQAAASALAGAHETAAILLGAAAAIARARDFRAYAYWQSTLERAESAARAALGDVAYVAARDRGRLAIELAPDDGADLLDLVLDLCETGAVESWPPA